MVRGCWTCVHDGHSVGGVKAESGRPDRDNAQAGAVVLAAGGFQANPEWRTRYLGPGWELAKVRGSRFNTGDGIRMALEAGAASYGNWSGGHAVAWDYNAPEFGDLAVGDGFQKHSYPWGVMVNAAGRRFVDEGADFRNYTYARYGRVILEQPDGFAWQVFDAQVAHLLRDEYRIRQVTKAKADTLEDLADRLEGVDRGGFLAEVAAYNAAVDTGHALRCNGQGRARHAWARGEQDELGQHDLRAALRGLPGRLRSHLHLRRPAHRPGIARRCWTATSRRSPASTPPASWSAACSGSTIRAARG